MARGKPVTSQTLGAIITKLSRFEKEAEAAGQYDHADSYAVASETLSSVHGTMRKQEREARRNGATESK